MSKIGRNDPCPCKSGKKYKKCCEAADRSERSQQIDQSAPVQLPPGHELYNMIVAIKPRPRPHKRRAPGQLARSGRMPTLKHNNFPGEHIAQTFMGAFQIILLTIRQANEQLEKSGHISAITTTLIALDRPKNRIDQEAYETVAKPYALLRAVTDSLHASTLDKIVRPKLDDEQLDLYQQLTQQRFEPWIFDPDQDGYLTAKHVELNTGRMTDTDIDGFFSISDHLPSAFHVAMPLEWYDHKILLGLGSLFEPQFALPYLLEAITNPTAGKSPANSLENTLLRYLLDPIPYLSDDDDDDDDYGDYDDDYPGYRPDIYDIALNILTYIHPIDPPEYEEYYVHKTFKDMIETHETKRLKTFQEHVEEDYETSITEDFDDAYDDFRETIPLSEIHQLLGSDAKQAAALLKKAKLKPAALLLDDALLKKLGVDRLDTIHAVEKAAQTQQHAQENHDITAHTQKTIHDYLRNYRMTHLLGLDPTRPEEQDDTIYWAIDYTYDLIMDCADERFKSIPLTQLPLTKAVMTRVTKAFGPDATIANLPARRHDLQRNIKGIGSVTANTLLTTINNVFARWPYILAGLDPNATPYKPKHTQKDIADTRKALDDLNKLFE